MVTVQADAAFTMAVPRTTRAPAAPKADSSSAFVPPTPDELQTEIAEVLAKQLSPDLQQWVDGYSQVGKRNHYLWKWCRQGVEVTALSSIDPERYDHVCDTKVLGVVLTVLLDDIADRKGDGELLEQLLALPFDERRGVLRRVSSQDRAYAEYTVDVWEGIKQRTRNYARYAEFATLRRFDYLQLFNAMRYSHLMNQQPSLLNQAEHDLYTPHNMHIIISATTDLMCSSSFDQRELGVLRDALWHAQCMGRIGNLVTTWERELGEGDYTSGVYARALAHGHVTLEQLEANDRDNIAQAIRAGGHEAFFLDRWSACRRRLLELSGSIQTVDLRALARGYERLIRLHLGSRGYK
jgi:hypothetical protein